MFFCILGYSKHIIFLWKSHIFGDFVGWDWGTPAILQQKHPWKNCIKIWDWQTPTPLSWDKRPNFSTDPV